MGQLVPNLEEYRELARSGDPTNTLADTDKTSVLKGSPANTITDMAQIGDCRPPYDLSFLKTSSAAEFLAFQPTERGDFRKRCLNFSVGRRRGTRRGRMC